MRSSPWGHFLTYVMLAITWAGVILAFSSLSGDDLPLPSTIPYLDKVAHFCAYTILGALILRTGPRQWTHPKAWWWILTCLTIGCAFGAFDEWYQTLSSGRVSSLADWLVDCVGVVTGLAAWIWYAEKSVSPIMPPVAPMEDKI